VDEVVARLPKNARTVAWNDIALLPVIPAWTLDPLCKKLNAFSRKNHSVPAGFML
jgi:hypothetical protein